MRCRLVTSTVRADIKREQDAANRDIQKQVDEANEKLQKNIDDAWEDFQSQIRNMVPRIVKAMMAVYLWQLHAEHGFGKKRLDRLLRNTVPMVEEDMKAMGFLDGARWVPDNAVGECQRRLETICKMDLNAPEYIEIIGGATPKVVEKRKEG